MNRKKRKRMMRRRRKEAAPQFIQSVQTRQWIVPAETECIEIEVIGGGGGVLPAEREETPQKKSFWTRVKHFFMRKK